MATNQPTAMLSDVSAVSEVSNLSEVSDWDFKGADTKTYTHGFHVYPAMMIPQIAGRLIDLYGGRRILLDPYCGTGTSLVEANLRGIHAVGSDLNPLARLISAAKTCRMSAARMVPHLARMRGKLLAGGLGDFSAAAPRPTFSNIDFWFSRHVGEKLAAIKCYIDEISDHDMRNFLLVVFSETVRECSYTRNGEFKLYRMAQRQREAHAPDVFGIFAAKMERNYAGLQAFTKAARGDARAQVFDFDSTHEIPPAAAPPQSVDIVVTSPPYGDSATTVAYGQFSRLANEWLGFEGAAAVDRHLMGGCKPKQLQPLGDDELDAAVGKISAVHHQRAIEVCGFYQDYRRSIGQVAATIKPGGVACYVVGNRKVKGIVLPTHRATQSYFEENQFSRERVFIRAIPNKRMPSRNSPSNIPGATDDTMCSEHIVVMRKLN